MNTFFKTVQITDVWLRVLNLDTVAKFYRNIAGLKEIGREKNVVRFSASGNDPAQIVLVGEPGSHPKKATAPGLFHTAFLLPSRQELAKIIRHIGEQGWRFQGFADHGVSEAVYLADSEGNGLEFYHDRPREEWPVGPEGVAMMTEALDVTDMIAEAPQPAHPDEGIHPHTIIGHIHLQTSNLENAEAFYKDVLGLDVTQRSYPGALFLSAGGYHHHIGVNIWNSRGSLPATPGSTGLISFGIQAVKEHAGAILSRARERNGVGDLKAAGNFRLLDPDDISIDISIL